MHVQIVTFKVSGMTHDELLKACDEQFAPAFSNVPGLLYKLWLADPTTNTYGGVYAWRDEPAMENFLASELFEMVRSYPHFTDIESKDFGILDGPTRITGGRVPSAAG